MLPFKELQRLGHDLVIEQQHHKGKESAKESVCVSVCVCVTESLHCTSEKNIVNQLYANKK